MFSSLIYRLTRAFGISTSLFNMNPVPRVLLHLSHTSDPVVSRITLTLWLASIKLVITAVKLMWKIPGIPIVLVCTATKLRHNCELTN